MQRGICHNNRVGNSFGELPDPNHSERVRFTMATDSNTREIPLTQGKVALVDADDYERLAQFNWYAVKHRHGFKAARSAWLGDKKRKMVLMHRAIMNASDDQQIDHIDRDPLNNRRMNLRVATRAENARNTNSRHGSTSTYLGVSWTARDRKWVARIQVQGSCLHLGYFADEMEAALAYDAAARLHFGEFANPNFKDATND